MYLVYPSGTMYDSIPTRNPSMSLWLGIVHRTEKWDAVSCWFHAGIWLWGSDPDPRTCDRAPMCTLRKRSTYFPRTELHPHVPPPFPYHMCEDVHLHIDYVLIYMDARWIIFASSADPKEGRRYEMRIRTTLCRIQDDPLNGAVIPQRRFYNLIWTKLNGSLRTPYWSPHLHSILRIRPLLSMITIVIAWTGYINLNWWLICMIRHLACRVSDSALVHMQAHVSTEMKGGNEDDENADLPWFMRCICDLQFAQYQPHRIVLWVAKTPTKKVKKETRRWIARGITSITHINNGRIF